MSLVAESKDAEQWVWLQSRRMRSNGFGCGVEGCGAMVSVAESKDAKQSPDCNWGIASAQRLCLARTKPGAQLTAPRTRVIMNLQNGR